MRRLHVLTALVALLSVTPRAHAQSCPTNQLRLGDDFLDTATESSQRVDSYGATYGYGSAWYRTWGDSLGYENSFAAASRSRVMVTSRLQLLGATTSAPVPIGIELRLRVDMLVVQEDPLDLYLAQTQVQLVANGTPLAAGSWSPAPTGGNYGGYPIWGTTATDTLRATFAFVPGVFVDLSDEAQAIGRTLLMGRLALAGDLVFTGLPPGTFLVACSGDTVAAGPALAGVGPRPASGLAIESTGANPSHGAIRLACSVPRGGTAYLKLFDANGRVLESRVWEAAESSRREATLGSSLAPGAYFVQLRQGTASTVRAVTVVR